MSEPVTIHYLEMPTIEHLRPKPCPDPDLTVAENTENDFRLNKSMYILVGTDYGWTDKLPWTDDLWRRYAEDENRRIFLASLDGRTAGYYELFRLPDGTVDIDYFGLAPGFTGRGIGGYLLTHAVKTAFESGATKVTVNTCTKDHPAALPNYLARGFRQVRTALKTDPPSRP